MFQTDLLAGKRILVTGGGTGLGAAMSRRFAELGAQPILCGRRLPVLEDAAAQIRTETGAQVDVHCCDVRDAAAVDAMMDSIWRTGALDVLVNNAAATFVARTERLSPRALDAVLGPTLHGALYCTLAAGRRWIDGAHRGCVLSILSTSVFTGRAFTVASAVAKSGLLAMTRSLAVEWGPKGIRLVGIAPGPFPTPGASARLAANTRGGDQAAQLRNPMGRTGRHIELANLASYLVSEQAGYINGETVTIDGGAHLRTSGAEDLLQWTDQDWSELAGKRPARST